MNCPHCGKTINVGALIGSISTPAKARAARDNGKLGGRPRKRKRVARRPNTFNEQPLAVKYTLTNVFQSLLKFRIAAKVKRPMFAEAA